VLKSEMLDQTALSITEDTEKIKEVCADYDENAIHLHLTICRGVVFNL